MRSILLCAASLAALTACSPPADTADAAPRETVAIDSRELAQAFAANEVAAKGRFEGKRLEVTGRVSSVELDFADDPVIMLPGTDDFTKVHATFPKEAAASTSGVSRGQTVTVVCNEISEVMGSPMLNDCSLK